MECWREARALVREIYKVTFTKDFNKDFGLARQVQRAATSVMANIAEGFVRKSDKEFVQFLFVSMSSAAEVQSHLYVALDLNYISDEQFRTIYSQADKTARIISALIKYLRASFTSHGSAKETRQTRQTE
ncbi:MAG TPA: four helix bundle protein [Syntrophorhabdales bacterium]|nr:four helix bundle protein [Syntrophorhabdales bacterium]